MYNTWQRCPSIQADKNFTLDHSMGFHILDAPQSFIRNTCPTKHGQSTHQLCVLPCSTTSRMLSKLPLSSGSKPRAAWRPKPITHRYSLHVVTSGGVLPFLGLFCTALAYEQRRRGVFEQYKHAVM